nr:hypothetical protein [Tanacetum cinerariifolium]
MDWGKLIQLMHTKMFLKEVKTLKIQIEYKYQDQKTQKRSSALEALWKTLFLLYLYLLGTLSDFKYLNKNDIEDMYNICLRRRNDTPKYKQQTALIQALLIYIKSCVIWERVHDFQLGIESYQIKVNLIAPTITYPSIEKDPLYSIIGVLFVGIVYENNKKEKRAMDIDEFHKFSDATLRRVLRKISVINIEARNEIVKIFLSDKDKELTVLLKEEIEERLKYRL